MPPPGCPLLRRVMLRIREGRAERRLGAQEPSGASVTRCAHINHSSAQPDLRRQSSMVPNGRQSISAAPLSASLRMPSSKPSDQWICSSQRWIFSASPGCAESLNRRPFRGRDSGDYPGVGGLAAAERRRLALRRAGWGCRCLPDWGGMRWLAPGRVPDGAFSSRVPPNCGASREGCICGGGRSGPVCGWSCDRRHDQLARQQSAPTRMCADIVRECDVYVGVLGTRYGSPVRDEPECRIRSWSSIPDHAGLTGWCCCWTRSEDVKVSRGSALIEREFGDRQDAFRRRVKTAG